MRRALPILIALVLAALLWLGLPTDPNERPSGPNASRTEHRDSGPRPPAAPDTSPHPLPGSADIAGIVHRAGKPVAVRIEVRGLGGARYESLLAAEMPLDRSTLSGIDGRFVVHGLTPGTYEVAAVAGDGARGAVHARLRKGRDHTTVTIAIPVDGLMIRGRAVWSDGRPFRGRIGAIGFEDRAMEGGEWSREVHVARTVETARDGTFALSGLPRALFLPTALIPGRVRFVGTPVRLPTQGEFLFMVDQGWRLVRGRVVEDDTGQPVPEAVVTRQEWGYGIRDLLFRTETDDRGRFETWVSAEHSAVYVSKDGFPRASGWLKNGEDEIVVRLRRFARVRGRVLTYESRQAVAGAVVHVARGGSALTEADGKYVLEKVPPGDRLIYVQGGGWVSTLLVNGGERPLEPLVVKVESGAEIERDLTAVAAARATVTVLDEDGYPVMDAQVTLRWYPRVNLLGEVRRTERPLVARTGPAGSCGFEPLVPGIWYWPLVQVAGRPDAPGGKFRALAAGPTKSVIRLEPCFGRTVRFVFADTKEPVAGAVVFGPDTWITDENGLTEIGPHLAGELKVYVTHPDVAWTRDALTLPEATEPVTIELARGSCLGGRATWAAGRPAAGAFALLLWGEDRDRLSVPVSFDGSFRFQRLPSTKVYGLRAWIRQGAKDLLSEEIPARIGAFDHVLVLRAAAQAEPKKKHEAVPRFVLNARGPDGEPVASGKVVLWIGRGTWVSPRSGTVRNGVCSLPIDENYEVRFAELFSCRTGERKFGARIERVDNQSSILEVRLEDGHAIRGKVVDPAGKPVIGAEVCAYFTRVKLPRRTDFAHATARTGEDGTFRLDGLGDLTYDIRIRPPKPWAPCEQQVRAGRSDVVAVVETAAVPVISVLDHDGKPVGRAYLRIEPEGGGRPVVNPYRSQAGADGKVRIEGLEPGKRYRLRCTGADNRNDIFPKTIDSWTPHDTEIRLDRAYTIDSWTPHDTEIRLDRAYEIRGVVHTETGDTPSGRVAVYLRRKGKDDWTREWASGGTFRFRMLTAGEYELKVRWTHGKEGDATLPIVTVQAGQEKVVLTLKGSR